MKFALLNLKLHYNQEVYIYYFNNVYSGKLINVIYYEDEYDGIEKIILQKINGDKLSLHFKKSRSYYSENYFSLTPINYFCV